MTQGNAVQELLAYLGRMISEEEAKTRQTIDRLLSYNEPAEDRIREEWYRFHQRIEPMRQQREYVLKQLAAIEACKAPAPMIFANGELAPTKPN